jgi:hypothetical protein
MLPASNCWPRAGARRWWWTIHVLSAMVRTISETEIDVVQAATGWMGC